MTATAGRLAGAPARRPGSSFTSYAWTATSALVLLVVVGLQLAGQDRTAQWTGSGFALAVAAYQALEMARALLRGRWGVDVLAVTAIVSTVAVGEYVASLVIVLMLTGGEALEEFAAQRAGRELRALLNEPRSRRIGGSMRSVTSRTCRSRRSGPATGCSSARPR